MCERCPIRRQRDGSTAYRQQKGPRAAATAPTNRRRTRSGIGEHPNKFTETPRSAHEGADENGRHVWVQSRQLRRRAEADGRAWTRVDRRHKRNGQRRKQPQRLDDVVNTKLGTPLEELFCFCTHNGPEPRPLDGQTTTACRMAGDWRGR